MLAQGGFQFGDDWLKFIFRRRNSPGAQVPNSIFQPPQHWMGNPVSGSHKCRSCEIPCALYFCGRPREKAFAKRHSFSTSVLRAFSALFDVEHTNVLLDCDTLASLMNKADSDRVHELCSLIAEEQDREKFLDLVRELNRILSEKDARLRDKPRVLGSDQPTD